MSETNSNQPQDYSADAEKAFRQAPWSAISIDGTLPEQLYDWKIIESYPGETFNDDPALSRFKWVLGLEVLKPIDYESVPLTVTFFIGTEDDPKAAKPSTWRTPRGHASNLRRLTHQCNVPDQPWNLKGKTFAAFVKVNESNGVKYTNLDFNYYTIGQIAPGTVTTLNQRYSHTAQANNGPVAQSATVGCDVCGQQVPRADIIDHIRTCQGASTTTAV